MVRQINARHLRHRQYDRLRHSDDFNAWIDARAAATGQTGEEVFDELKVSKARTLAGLAGGLIKNEAYRSKALNILGDRPGIAIDFVNGRAIVNDPNNLANNFDGDPEVLLTKYGADPYDYDADLGLNLDKTRDFAVSIDITKIPFDPTAIHCFAKFQLNAGTDATDYRYILSVAHSGNSRFSHYFQNSQEYPRVATGDGTTLDVHNASGSITAVANETYETFFGADANGHSWVWGNEDGSNGALIRGLPVTQEITNMDNATSGVTLSASATATNGFIGIGGEGDEVDNVLDGHLAEICIIFENTPLADRIDIFPFLDIYFAEGDSHTFNTSFTVGLEEFYPSLVAGSLAGYGYMNGGTSGDSSVDMLGETPAVIALWDKLPSLVSIYAGSNDTTDMIVQASPAPTDTVFTVDSAARVSAGGYIVLNGEERLIASIATNEITLTTALSAAPSASDIANIATTRNIVEWVALMEAAGLEKSQIKIIGAHYLNFASGGDTTSAEQNLRGRIRDDEEAAAIEAGVEYIDVYAYQAALITAGNPTQGDDASWHVATGNTHLNEGGEAALADAIANAV